MSIINNKKDGASFAKDHRPFFFRPIHILISITMIKKYLKNKRMSAEGVEVLFKREYKIGSGSAIVFVN